MWSCVFCIYVSPRVRVPLLNFLYAIFILAFWLGSAQYIPFLLKTLSVTVHFMPMSITFWLPTAWLIHSFWPSYQRCRNDNKCNPNEKAVFPHLIYLQRLSTLCGKWMSSSFSKSDFNMFTIVDILYFWTTEDLETCFRLIYHKNGHRFIPS